MIKYTIVDYNQINNNYNSTLDSNIFKTINELAKLVGDINYKKTPIFKENKKWKNIKNFKKTKLVKNIENFDILTSLLNKITDNNYIEIKDNIINHMKCIKNNNESLKTFNELGNFIFNVASKNKFWCKLYAKLCFDLNNQFPIIKNICNTNFNTFLNLFKNIRVSNPEENYELFCQINNENEKRKSICCFYSHLVKYNIISENNIMQIINHLINIIKKNINNADFKNQAFEICECLCILIKKIHNTSNEYNSNIMNNFIEFIINIEIKKNKAISSKTYFKFMDLKDEIE